MRTRRDKALQGLAEASVGIDAAMAELRKTAGHALRDPLRMESVTRLLRAAILLPVLGLAATATDAAPDILRRSRNSKLDEPASDE